MREGQRGTGEARNGLETQVLHAYLQGPDAPAVTAWVESVAGNAGPKRVMDLRPELGVTLTIYESTDVSWIVEERTGVTWLELTIRVASGASRFAAWDNIMLGERLVDDLGGHALVDGLGTHTSSHSDRMVRISTNKLELVVLPDTFDDPFDEHLTRLIRTR